MKRIYTSQSGVTLIELMVTISIAAILAGGGVSLMMKSRAQNRLNGAALEMLSAFQEARVTALKKNRNVVVVFQMVGGSYTGVYYGFTDDGGTATTDVRNNKTGLAAPDGVADTAVNMTKDAGEETIFDINLPEGIDIVAANFNGASMFGFDNKGFPYDSAGNLVSGSVRIKNFKGDERKVELFISGYTAID